MSNTVKEFWDDTLHKTISQETFEKSNTLGVMNYLKLLNNYKGLSVLDLGCGNGNLSVYMAKLGNKVVSVDISQTAIDNTSMLAKINGVEVETKLCDAMDLKSLAIKFDVIVGVHVLHHIEPFEIFVNILKDIMTDKGCGVFLENNSRNSILMFNRKFIAGRFGIPKYGDAQEQPFQPKEVKKLKKVFKTKVIYPEFLFFKLAGVYIFKNNKSLINLTNKIDCFFYKYISIFNCYSYSQVIKFIK